jgi:polyprenyl-phospho-N-acetylgalactosaminyl synthase
MKIFVVIPAYNEEKSIAAVIESLLLKNYRDIVVINDGSKDNTAEVVKKYPVYYLEHFVNLGQGAALQTGNEFALARGADVIVHFDADGQLKVDDISRFLEKINQGFDVVIGSRFLSDKQNIPFAKKYFILKPGIVINWLFSGLKLSDVHNGFRVFTGSAAVKLKITQNRMAHATEIPALILRHKLKHAEVPVEIIYNEFGQGFWGGLKIVWDLLKVNIFN